MEFRKYQHIERFGSSQNVGGIEQGICYVFPKIDGTNSSTWLNNGELKAGSHNRELTLDKDNAGFYNTVSQNENIKAYHAKHPTHRLFGEWLCLSGDTIIRKTSGGKNSNYMTIKEMYDYSQKKIIDNYNWINKDGSKKSNTKERNKSWWDRHGYPSIFSLYIDEDKIKPNKIQNIIYTGEKEVYRVVTRKGYTIKTTINHPFYTPNGFKKLEEIKINDCVAVSELSSKGRKKRSYGKGTNAIFKQQEDYKNKIGKCEKCGLTSCLELHHKDGNHENNHEENFQVLCNECHKKETGNCFNGFEYDYEFDKVISIEYVGIEDCYDISMEGTENTMNFIANGFIVHNCPHTLRTYREDAWRRFYIFDVCIDNDEVETGLEYIPYEIYKPLLEEFNLDYIAPIAIIKNGEYDNFIRCLEQNIFLIKDGQGFGEGIVIKNYDYYNKYNRQNWAKIVTSEFKEKHTKTMGCPVVDNKMVEESIVDEFITTAFVEKEYAKIVNEQGDWNSKLIPQLLGIVYHELVTEEIWNICKKFKNPTINFKALNNMTINKIKSIKPEIFG